MLTFKFKKQTIKPQQQLNNHTSLTVMNNFRYNVVVSQQKMPKQLT